MIRPMLVNDNTGEIIPVKSERFTKTMLEVWRKVTKTNIFTFAEERVLNRLSLFLQLNTNAIVKGSQYMNIESMAEETGIDRSNIRKTIKQLMKKNALGMWRSGDNEIYYMNPFLYQNGNIQPYLFNMFDQEYHERCKREHLEKFKAGKKITSILITKTNKKVV